MATGSRLAREACEACTGSTPVVAGAERDALRAELHQDWRVTDDGAALVRSFRFRDFAEAFAFAVRVAFIAEAEEHHPDLLVGWGRCEVRLTTHAVQGLTRNDFIVAAKVDRILG
jgi:4a-hydroxytetrahydrobiopterin dehydratase